MCTKESNKFHRQLMVVLLNMANEVEKKSSCGKNHARAGQAQSQSQRTGNMT